MDECLFYYLDPEPTKAMRLSLYSIDASHSPVCITGPSKFLNIAGICGIRKLPVPENL